MPTRERVEAFIKTVEAGKYVEAIEAFYAHDATMRENLDPPRQSLPVLVAQERAMLKRVEHIETKPVERYLIDGDRVVINWVFDILGLDGVTRRMDELTIQRWQGDTIVEEQFYYDPKLRTA
jgi:hypothetical protein